MTEITSKELHEQTGSVLDSVKRGQRFRVLRNGTADALLVPANEEIDPSWDEIMANVRKARANNRIRKLFGLNSKWLDFKRKIMCNIFFEFFGITHLFY